MHSYEVEVKSLLGSEENAEMLRKKMQEIDPASHMTSKNKQLNHYFIGGSMDALVKASEGVVSPEAHTKLADLLTQVTNVSVRTRNKDGQVLLVAKVSVGDDTSSNGVSRIEFEETVDITLEQLDRVLLGAGFRYQAKWSREREEYSCRGLNVCLDKNAGYGYLSEFEIQTEVQEKLDETKQKIMDFMGELGLKELSQDRLERMFEFYNKNWRDYYGTEKVFNIE
ncbi:hypothetical protein A2389_01290 [Candidatus Adlerbacteria bacterium RIFOXYB1_FULL_48_10]|nr:MAG: hypothetical protein A2389_01290 [Candidatus Adlerbacteria bacterium RIFOXYB1_FULL_48_10]